LPTKEALGAQVQQTSKNAATPPPINATKSLACGIALLDRPSSARSSRPKRASRQGDLFYGSIGETSAIEASQIATADAAPDALLEPGLTHSRDTRSWSI